MLPAPERAGVGVGLGERRSEGVTVTGTNLLPLDILEFISGHGGHPTLQEIIDGLILRRNTAYRAIAALEESGWVSTSGRPKRVSLTPKLILLSRPTLIDRVRTAVFPNAVDVATQTGWTCNISYYDNGDAIYTDSIEYHGERLLVTPTGARLPAALSAGGRALLACQSPAEIERIASQELPAMTPWSKVSREEILAEVKLTRQRGYSYIERELSEDLVGVGMAVFDENGVAVSALSTATRMAATPSAIELCVRVLRRATERASLELGYVASLGLRRGLT